MMARNTEIINRLGQALTSRAASPVGVPSAYVQQPGAYTGGGLPMPIGLVASDPALSNPSLLNLPGMGEFQNIFSGLGLGDPGGRPDFDPPGMPPGAGTTPTDGFDPDTGAPLPGFDDFYLPPFDQRTPQNPNGTTDGLEPRPDNVAESRSDGTGTRRRSNDDGAYGELVRASDLLPDQRPGDDLSQAMGAIDLLLQAYGQPAR